MDVTSSSTQFNNFIINNLVSLRCTQRYRSLNSPQTIDLTDSLLRYLDQNSLINKVTVKVMRR